MLHSVHCWVKVLCAVGGEMHLRRPPKEAIKLGVHQATNHQKQQIDPIFLSQDQDMDNIHWISQTQTLQILISIVWCMTNPHHFDQSPMPNMSSSPRPSLRLVFLLQEPEHAAPILQKGDIGWWNERFSFYWAEPSLRYFFRQPASFSKRWFTSHARWKIGELYNCQCNWCNYHDNQHYKCSRYQKLH